MSDERGEPIDKRYLGARDATTLMLGELLGKVDALKEGARDRDRKLDVITNTVENLTNNFGKFEERYKGSHDALRVRVDALAELVGDESRGAMQRIRSLEDARRGQRNMMMGAAAVVGLSASKAWTVLTWLFDKWPFK